MRLDPLDHLIEEVECFFARQSEENRPEATILVTPNQPLVHFRQSESLLEVASTRPFLERIAIDLDRREPVVLAFEVLTSVERGVGISFDRTRFRARLGFGRIDEGKRWGEWDEAQRQQEPPHSEQGQGSHRGRSSHGGASTAKSAWDQVVMVNRNNGLPIRAISRLTDPHT
jgi:hypothetical protein